MSTENTCLFLPLTKADMLYLGDLVTDAEQPFSRCYVLHVQTLDGNVVTILKKPVVGTGDRVYIARWCEEETFRCFRIQLPDRPKQNFYVGGIARYRIQEIKTAEVSKTLASLGWDEIQEGINEHNP